MPMDRDSTLRIPSLTLPATPPASPPAGQRHIHPNAEATDTPALVSRSLRMRQLCERLPQLSASRLILIEGEAGAGKQLLAKHIHRHVHSLGPVEGNLVVEEASSVFCEDAGPQTPLPADALTKAVDRAGHRADIGAARGTLLFRGIDELSTIEQEQLLRFIRSFETAISADAPGPIACPFRIVCTSRQPLRARVLEGRFLPELYYRLSAICISLPALRERKEDMPGLVQGFIETFSRENRKPLQGLASGALAVLLRHRWPGNVRELESVVRAACFAAEGQWLRPIDLVILPLDTPLIPANDPALPQDLTLDGVVRRHVLRVLRLCSGNKARAAARLGVSRSTLYRMLESEAHSALPATDPDSTPPSSIVDPSSAADSGSSSGLMASQ